MRVAIAHNQVEGEHPPGETDLSLTDVLESVRSVETTLRALGHQTVRVEFADDPLAFAHALLAARPEVAFNLCEAARYESRLEMHAAALIELLDVPLTGCPAFTLGILLDKGLTKDVLRAHGIRTAPDLRLQAGEELPAEPRAEILPAVVKPMAEDASVGIERASLAESWEEVGRAVAALRGAGIGPVLVERYLPGRELTALTVGDREPSRVLFGEVDYSGLPAGAPRILTYDAKWIDESEDYAGTPTRYPAELAPALATELETIARTAWRALGCHGFIRLDTRLDERGAPHVLEVNPNPALAAGAGVQLALETAGIGFDTFIGWLVNWAWAHRPPTRVRPAPPRLDPVGGRPIPLEARHRDPVARLLATGSTFTSEEMRVALELFDTYLGQGVEGDYAHFGLETEGTLAGYICIGPTPMTQGTWDLYWLCVDPTYQRQGVGRRLTAFAEGWIATRGGRLVMVETSSQPAYAGPRAFYERMGYRQEARIAGYYRPGDDLCTYVKSLRGGKRP